MSCYGLDTGIEDDIVCRRLVYGPRRQVEDWALICGPDPEPSKRQVPGRRLVGFGVERERPVTAPVTKRAVDTMARSASRLAYMPERPYRPPPQSS